MAAVRLGTKAVGSIVKIKENGAPVEYIVVHQGIPSSLYDESCDGTWVLRKDIFENRQWHSSNVNDYANSTIHSYLNSTFLNLLDADIKAAVKQVKIPYRPGSGTSKTIHSGADGLSAKIFLLSDREVGYTQSNVNQYIVNDGAKLSYFTDANAGNDKLTSYKGTATSWWIRSPYTGSDNSTWYVHIGGVADYSHCSNAYGIRPAFILPTDLFVSDNAWVTVFVAPSAPATITTPLTPINGRNYGVNWEAATDADGNLSGYELERSADGGSTWTRVYTGTALAFTETVGDGWTSLCYRVRAIDTGGLTSGWTAGPERTVYSPSTVILSGTDEDLGAITGAAVYEYAVTTESGNPASVTEQLNGKMLRTYSAASGETQTAAVPAVNVAVGRSTLVITATISGVTATRTVTFEKPELSMPTGPYRVPQWQDHKGVLEFPQTLAEAVFLPNGESLASTGFVREFPPVTITVPAAGWAGTGPWTQTVSVAGITADMTGIGLYMVDVSDAAARKLYEAAYGCLAAEFETLDGGVKLTCRDKKPTTNFQAQLRGVKP